MPARIGKRFDPLELNEGKNYISRKRKAKQRFPKKLNLVQFGAFQPMGKVKMFPGKLNCVQFKKGADSYRMGNRMRAKSFGNSYPDS
jgi:hypothetical protein